MKTKKLNALMLGALLCLAFNGQAQNVQRQIKTYLSSEKDNLGLSSSDINEWRISSQHESKEFGINHIYVNQQYQGVDVFNAANVFAIKDGEVYLTGDRFERNLESRIGAGNAVLTPVEAIQAAAKNLAIPNDNNLNIQVIEEGKYTETQLSRSDIPVRAVYFEMEDESFRLAYDMSFDLPKGDHYWSVRIDAQTGEIIDVNDWIISCQFHKEDNCEHEGSTRRIKREAPALVAAPAMPPGTDQYNVYAMPTESPSHGPRTLVVGPYSPTASPFGWHDTDGVAGPEYTVTRGNNVRATEDTDDNNNPGYAPDGGASLNFDFPLSFTTPIEDLWDPVVTNLFYWNNIIHDVLYRYGFDEQSGNFQQNNYGNGGQGSDYVNADAQDGGGLNNANFSTPTDGSKPRMQMYLWGAAGTPQHLEITAPVGFAGIYDATPAILGPGIPGAGLTGNMVVYEDGAGVDVNDACEPPTNGAALNGNIAVIRRGNCGYVDKIVAAEAAGAIAVIIVNTGAGTLTMGGTDPGIGIPSIMITSVDGEAFIAEIMANGSMSAILDDYGPFDIDGDFDSGIVSHEYGHGVSTRLTGGPNNSSALWNEEQMGEGWSDYIGLMLTMAPGDQGGDIQGIGTYTSSEPVNGPGIRPQPYSTDWSINNATYGTTNSPSITQPHGVGFVWCSMLWEMTWGLIDLYGYDPDIYNGNGGNNIALQLVMEGMKLQPNNPGFVDGRDAILAADQLLYAGANQCVIWEAFAKRGLGFSADQGDPDDRFDQVGAFDLPPNLDHTTTATSCQTYTWAENGQTYTQSGEYTTPFPPQFGCDSVATLYLTITNSISTSVSYVTPTVLQANAVADTYQWLDCSNSMAIIPGETSNTFNATQNGIVAVVLTQGICTDTSVCLLINQAGLEEDLLADALSVYPNPTTGDLSIDFNDKNYDEVTVKVMNSLGQVVYREHALSVSKLDIAINSEPGIYFVEVNADNAVQTIKVIKQD